MCPPVGDSMAPEADPPGAGSGPGGSSASGSGLVTLSTPSPTGNGSSPVEPSAHVLATQMTLPQPDPTAAGAAASQARSDVLSAPVASPAVTSEPPARPATRLQHGISKPKVHTDGTVRWCQLASTSSDEPSSLAEAQGDPKWVAAMNLEHQALLRNQTWHLVTPSKGKNIVGCKWVYKVKRKADGTGMLGCAVSCSDLVLFLPKPTPLFSTTTRMGTLSLFLSMLMILLLRVHPLKPQMHS